jgi:hypothetical protein
VNLRNFLPFSCTVSTSMVAVDTVRKHTFCRYVIYPLSYLLYLETNQRLVLVDDPFMEVGPCESSQTIPSL